MKKAIFTLMIMMCASMALIAQQKDSVTGKADSVTQVIYTCSMHPEVQMDKAGKCPKCGMELMQQEVKVPVKKIYTCPKHAEITSDKPGKCSKCGTSLTLSKKEEMKMKVMGIYACPMHPDITSEKAGTCSKCGMDLVKKKPTK